MGCLKRTAHVADAPSNWLLVANITKNLNRKLLLISFNDSRALARVKRAQRSTMGKKIYPSQKIW